MRSLQDKEHILYQLSDVLFRLLYQYFDVQHSPWMASQCSTSMSDVMFGPFYGATTTQVSVIKVHQCYVEERQGRGGEYGRYQI